MLSKLIRNKKGVSEVIASLVLILIVTAAGVVIYAYSVGAFGLSSSYFHQQTTLNEEQARERFLIVRVWRDASNQFNLTILNYGQIDVAVNSVYVNGTAVTDFISGRGDSVGPSELVWVKFISPLIIQPGSIQEILVVTERGGKNAVFWKA